MRTSYFRHSKCEITISRKLVRIPDISMHIYTKNDQIKYAQKSSTLSVGSGNIFPGKKTRKLRRGSKVSIFPLNIFNYGGTGVENGHSLRESSPEILRHLSSGKTGLSRFPHIFSPIGETGPIPQRNKFYWTPNKCDS